MIKGVVLNERLTAIMAESGMDMKFYDIPCPVCGKMTDIMVGPTEDLEVRVEIHLLELQEYHNPNDWSDCPDQQEPEADGGATKKSTQD